MMYGGRKTKENGEKFFRKRERGTEERKSRGAGHHRKHQNIAKQEKNNITRTKVMGEKR